MTHYFCIATGQADFLPTSQDYHSAADETEMRAIVAAACEQWEKEMPEADDTRGDEFYSHEFRMPREGENNWSQRLRIDASSDYVLDVIGMTADEYAREAEGE